MTLIIKQSDLLIDWITIIEDNLGKKFPLIDNGYKLHYDKNNELVYETAIRYKHEGSYSSTFSIRVNSKTREIKYNPSRFNKRDNLHGVNITETKIQINEILKGLEQPPITDRSKVTRIDVTANIQTGSKQNLIDYFYHLSRISIPRFDTRQHKNTIYYGKTSKVKTLKAYIKYKELIANTFKTAKSIDKPYIKKLSNHCKENGIIRLELKLQQRWLVKNNLNIFGNITMEKLNQQYQKEIKPLTKSVRQLEIEKLTNAELGTLAMYQQGYDLKKRLSKNTFYKHKKSLLEIGYDISVQNIKHLQPPAKLIQLKAAVPPPWYEWNEKKQIKLVLD